MKNKTKKILRILATLILITIAYCCYTYPFFFGEKSPFTTIDWQNEKVWIDIDGKTYEWLESEAISIAEIKTFAKKEYGILWHHKMATDYILVMKDLDRWVFFSTKMKIKDAQGNIIEDDFSLSLENREAALSYINNQQKVRRNHTPTIPDSLQYITQRLDGYQAKQGVPAVITGTDVFEYNLSLPMDSWVPRELVIDDLEHLEFDIKNNFSYATLKGVNYQLIIDAIIADIKEGISKRDLGIQIKILLSLFGDGHSRVSRSMLKIDSLFLPFEIKIIEDKYVATSNDQLFDMDYPEIVSIDTVPISTLKEKAGEMAPKGSPQLYESRSLKYLSYYGYLQRKMDKSSDKVKIEFANGKDTINKTIELIGKEGLRKIFDRKESHHKLLESDIGYIYLHKMERDDDYQKWLHEALEDFKDTKGLIIDIRGNGGGSRKPIYSLLPYFLKSPKVINVNALRINKDLDPDINESIGGLEKRMAYPAKSVHWTPDEQKAISSFKQDFVPEWGFDKSKFSKWHYSVVSPNDEYYNKPVILLMDERNFSASDIFLGAFKGTKNVTLIGVKSGGGSGFARVGFLSNSGMTYLMSRMASFQPNGKLYEGNGVTPDIEISVTINDIKIEKDVALGKAIKTIRSQTKKRMSLPIKKLLPDTHKLRMNRINATFLKIKEGNKVTSTVFSGG